MQIVIDINDKVYGLLKYFEKALGLNNKKDDSDDVKTALMRAVIHGTPLPKGHGKLVDIDLLRDQVSHDEREAFSKHQVWLLLSVHNKKIPTIIEADKAESENP